MVRDARSDYSAKEMHAALDIKIPNYASAVVTTKDVVSLSGRTSLQELPCLLRAAAGLFSPILIKLFVHP